MQFFFHLMLVEVLIALPVFVGLALHSTKNVSRQHLRWITATWAGVFIGVSGPAMMFAVLRWADFSPSTNRVLGLIGLLMLVGGVVATIFSSSRELRARSFYEHKRNQKHTNFWVKLESVGIFRVPRMWISDWEWQN